MTKMDNTKGFDAITFAEMLNTRFCHDLAGPISAVNNGMDFLQDDSVPEMQEQAFDLLKMSAEEALSKLQTYRLAYGRVGHGGTSSVDELKDVMQRYFQHNTITLDWPDEPDGSFGTHIDNDMRRLLVNMITTVSRELVYGGTLSVRAHQEGNTKTLTISGTAEKLKKNTVVQAIFQQEVDAEPLSPVTIPAYFIVEVAKQQDITLSYALTETNVTFTAHYV